MGYQPRSPLLTMATSSPPPLADGSSSAPLTVLPLSDVASSVTVAPTVGVPVLNDQPSGPSLSIVPPIQDSVPSVPDQAPLVQVLPVQALSVGPGPRSRDRSRESRGRSVRRRPNPSRSLPVPIANVQQQHRSVSRPVPKTILPMSISSSDVDPDLIAHLEAAILSQVAPATSIPGPPPAVPIIPVNPVQVPVPTTPPPPPRTSPGLREELAEQRSYYGTLVRGAHGEALAEMAAMRTRYDAQLAEIVHQAHAITPIRRPREHCGPNNKFG